MSSHGYQLRASRRTREIFVRNLEPPPTSWSQSRSGSPQPSIHNRLYEKDAETNLLNYVDFLSEEDVNVERDIPLIDAKLVGLGSTMEVYSTTWKGQQVAVKRIRRDKMPTRSANLPYEHDTAFATATREFYSDIRSTMQEILVMSREPLSTHRNIVHLLAVSWDDDKAYWANHLFPPLMVVELANADAPTLYTFYMNRSGSKSFSTDIGFVADIADGLSALHMCGVVHGDLKPQNILLFDDPETKGGLVAKVADFGFSNIEFLKEGIRGESERWEAPERIHGCPEEIMTATQELDNAGCASDVYSFGLVAVFVALDGVDSLAIQGVGNGKSAGIENAIRELKFTDQARTKVEKSLRAYYEGLDCQESDVAKGLRERYVSLIHNTLQSIPPKRISSLGGMRLRLTGRDQFARQRELDRFKVRPFGDAFNSSSTRRTVFTKPKNPFSNKVLNSLPDRVETELRAIVGKTPELGESQLHVLRRIRLYNMEKNTKTKTLKEAPAIDYENVKVTKERIGHMISSARDWFDIFSTLGTRFHTIHNAELEFLDLDSGIRPQLFTLIDGNRLKEARGLLRANPSLIEEVEPETGWYPIHLAACEGRTQFLRMFISEFGANPNLRSRYSRSTPLHQAVGETKVEAVKVLLNMGAHVDAKFSRSEESQKYTALEQAMDQFPSICPSQDSMELIRVLLQGGADYLRNFNGYPIIYSACKHINLLRLFLDCIGPEDSRLVVRYRDSQKETMLHSAVFHARFDVVKLLLEIGADPGSRDINGHTAYVKLLTFTLSLNTAGTIPLQGMIALLNRKQFSLEDANRVLALLEEIGGDASALDDDTFSKEEVDKIHSNLKSGPRLGKVYNPIQITNAQFQISRYLNSDSPCISKVTSIIEKHPLITLAQSLATWAANRKEGLIPLDSLPEGWTEFFEEADREMNGLLTRWMQEDEIPELTKLVKATTISACEWIVKKNGPRISLLVTRIIHEFIKTGAAVDLEENLTSILTTARRIYQEDIHVSWTTKIFALQRLKRTWRAINKGEILDLFYDLAVLVNFDQSLDNMDDYTLFQPLRSGPQTPSWTLDNLSLAKRYSEARIFVTTKHLLPPRTRVALFFAQLAIFLLPFLLFALSVTLAIRNMRYDSSFIVIATYLGNKLFPAGWVSIDRNYRLHPNILRGLQAAWELVVFRAWYWFWYQAEEPLILSISSKPANRVDIPSRLDSMHENALFPIYWLSLKPGDIATPVPCYAAMGELMTKWKNGGLPRNAWGNGWWELREDGGHGWKRVNVTERPTWSDYSKASNEIKEHLLAKDREDVHGKFLEIRDYYLETTSQQLIAMNKLFGDEHSACFMIWQRLFVDENEPKPKPYKRRNKLGWLDRIVAEFRLDQLRDLIVYTWDEGLLDEEGRPLGTL